MNIILKLSDDAFEILDELLLMCESEQLFPIVSLLRLLLVYPDICGRYSKDFMIINQILYKIGIEFEEEEVMKDNTEEKVNANDINDEDMGMNLADINLLQFTAITAVSHLYNGDNEMIKIEDGFINLGLNALNVKNTNVRLAASRLLFNLVYEIKRQYIFMINDTSDLSKDYNKDIEILMKQLNKIINGIGKYYKAEKHVPTAYRLLCIYGLISYCDDENKQLLKQINNLDNNKIKQLQIIDNQEQLKSLQNDIITVFA